MCAVWRSQWIFLSLLPPVPCCVLYAFCRTLFRTLRFSYSKLTAIPSGIGALTLLKCVAELSPCRYLTMGCAPLSSAQLSPCMCSCLCVLCYLCVEVQNSQFSRKPTCWHTATFGGIFDCPNVSPRVECASACCQCMLAPFIPPCVHTSA